MSRKDGMSDAEKAIYDNAKKLATAKKNARAAMHKFPGYDDLPVAVQTKMDAALVSAIAPFYATPSPTPARGAVGAGVAAAAAAGGFAGLTSSSAPAPPAAPVLHGPAPPPPASAPAPIDVPRSGTGLAEVFRHATRSDAGEWEWDAFLAAFAAHYPPEFDRKIIVEQLRHELGMDHRTKPRK